LPDGVGQKGRTAQLAQIHAIVTESPLSTFDPCARVGGPRIACEAHMTAAWLAFARWAVGVAPWEPTLADAVAPTVISQVYTATCRFAAPSVAFWIGSGAAGGGGEQTVEPQAFGEGPGIASRLVTFRGSPLAMDQSRRLQFHGSPLSGVMSLLQPGMRKSIASCGLLLDPLHGRA